MVRRTTLQFVPRPSALTAYAARLDVALEPRQEATLEVAIRCVRLSALPAGEKKY